MEESAGIGPTIQTSNAVKKEKSESVGYGELEKSTIIFYLMHYNLKNAEDSTGRKYKCDFRNRSG